MTTKKERKIIALFQTWPAPQCIALADDGTVWFAWFRAYGEKGWQGSTERTFDHDGPGSGWKQVNTSLPIDEEDNTG